MCIKSRAGHYRNFQGPLCVDSATKFFSCLQCQRYNVWAGRNLPRLLKSAGWLWWWLERVGGGNLGREWTKGGSQYAWKMPLWPILSFFPPPPPPILEAHAKPGGPPPKVNSHGQRKLWWWGGGVCVHYQVACKAQPLVKLSPPPLMQPQPPRTHTHTHTHQAWAIVHTYTGRDDVRCFELKN